MHSIHNFFGTHLLRILSKKKSARDWEEEQGSAQEAAKNGERELHKLNGKTFNFANVIKNTFCVAMKKKG